MLRTNDRAVVVTGASTGIGAACALHLDRGGFLVFAGVRKAQNGVALQQRGSNRLTSLLLDVTDADSIQKAKEFVAGKVGEAGLFGLINNAGIAVAGPLEAVPIPDLRRQLEVNVIGQVAVTQSFLPPRMVTASLPNSAWGSRPRMRAAAGFIVLTRTSASNVITPLLRLFNVASL